MKQRVYLVERGLPADRVIAMGFGSTRPRSDGRTEQGRQRNRRVERWLRPAGDVP